MKKQQPEITFRCRGRTNRSELHLIEVKNDRAFCSCMGTDWCSHIEATLISGERHMVPKEDHHLADRAQAMLSTVIIAPEGWLASWKDDRVWRGLAAPRKAGREKTQFVGKPTVVFLGHGTAGRRGDYLEHARSLGWRPVNEPEELTTLVVATDASLMSSRGETAIILDLPIVSYEVWDNDCYEITNAVLDKIEIHLGQQTGIAA